MQTHIERGELEHAFNAFNRLAEELQSSYAVLQAKVASLTAELEESRRARESAAAEAQHLAARLQSLFATLPAGIVVVDELGIVREANPGAAQLLGGEPTGRPWQDVVRDAFASGGAADGDWLTADGRRLTLTGRPLPEERAKIVLLTDVTDTRALQQLVDRNDRLSAIGRMAATLAHQIRTPLAGALLYLSQCRARAGEPRFTALLERGIERLHHLERLVQDMLVFARGTGACERVRVADLFRNVADAIKAVQPPNAHLAIDGTDVLVQIEGNRTALTAALTNLVANAFESRPDVVVSLKAEQRGDRIEITVRDNGPGIAPSIRSKVFEPFFSTRPAGTGLGLAVVKTVADAHGAELAVESEVGCGTSIGIALPRAGLPSEQERREAACA